ncbi:YkvA family protein [Azospirillum rugosum]|uniref:Uncharacterized membrane protein YkvA (DUF1232 family) n=1 Tax=Azospirillum rugosum TaxID=416170 RepID=A0ABS4SVQ2_9PROT|nr:YkvA family protein [Azospirillum rugosum]MBP2296642.1 uncharacterized membrane protein YkvA (DUF1232 family) [Azospirillum rugosum]MDQ0530299.1 uncharacterized membrane protein YkvA (DUF1232 family) [Azospirillum rugosum]
MRRSGLGDAMQTAGDRTGTGRALPAVIDRFRAERDERYVRRGLWNKLRANLHRVPVLDQALAAYFCATDPVTPFRAKAMLMGALAYFILPSDTVPDWMVAIGFADDAAVLAAAIQAVRSSMKPEHQERARTVLETERRRHTPTRHTPT